MLKDSAWVAMDTEFVRQDTYHPIPALVQCAVIPEGSKEPRVMVLDCLDPSIDWSVWHEALSREGLTSVWFSLSEDSAVMHQLGFRGMAALRDLQWEAMMVGLGESVSLGTLAGAWLGLTVDKSSQWTDWLRRPLSQKQWFYAIEDAKILSRLVPLMDEALFERGRMGWATEEVASVWHESRGEWPRYASALRSLPSTAGWSELQRRRLRHAAYWREWLAHRSNRTRQRVCSDEVLMAWAMKTSSPLEALAAAVKDRLVPEGVVGPWFPVELVPGARLEDTDPALWPWHGWMELVSVEWTVSRRKRLKQCRALLKDHADRLGLVPRLLLSREELERGVLEPGLWDPTHPWWTTIAAWKRPLLEPLLPALAKAACSEGSK
jgi:ribonuclease D